MKILFVTFGELSIGGGIPRAISILRALADAGHQIDVLASHVDIADHSHIRILAGHSKKRLRRANLRLKVIQATAHNHYDAIHAVDDAVCFISSLCKLRKLTLIYDASRRFTGTVGLAPSRRWKLFPGYFQRLEKKILQQAAAILTPCRNLSADLRDLVPDAVIFQIEDIPVQSLFSRKKLDRPALINRFKGSPSSIVVCSILPGNQCELKTLLMSTRKVVEAIPLVAFIFKGANVTEAKSMATNLDILGRCIFLELNETEEFLAALDIADTALFFPQSDGRYVHPEVFTLLYSPAPLVAIQDGVYENLLTDNNSVQVLPSIDSIAEGILQVIQEPLFSLGIATEGQQLIADNYSLSSFKHKVRMAYHEVLTTD